MNESYKPVTIEELENWMRERCFNFNSYSINGNFICEGLGIEKEGQLFSWYFTERGKKEVLKYFGTEHEIVAYAFDQLRSDTWARTHCIGFTANKKKADELCMLLKDLNIEYIEDSIPYYGPERPVYRIFVLGCSIRQTEHLKEKYKEAL